uniref:Uncharacterized protein n=1 Tax=Anguilla anguilla TaxID=7936 RepID=A0A0E9VAS5_ANGAN
MLLWPSCLSLIRERLQLCDILISWPETAFICVRVTLSILVE